MSMRSIATTVALYFALTTSASADFGIRWSGNLQQLPGNPVTEIWQSGVVPNNGMGISDWCASRFGNGYECVDAFVAQNQGALQQFTCGGPADSNWLCAGVSYLFPQGTNAVQPATRTSPNARDLQAYLAERFDRQGRELASQHAAIEASQQQLLAGQQQLLSNQANLLSANQQQTQSLDRIETKIDDLVVATSNSFAQVGERLNRLEGSEGQPPPAVQTGQNVPAPQAANPPPPQAQETNSWLAAFYPLWPLLLLVLIIALLWLLVLWLIQKGRAWWNNRQSKQAVATDTATDNEVKTVAFVGETLLPKVYNRKVPWTVQLGDQLCSLVLTRRKSDKEGIYIEWNVSQLPPDTPTDGNGYFSVKDVDDVRSKLQGVVKKGGHIPPAKRS